MKTPEEIQAFIYSKLKELDQEENFYGFDEEYYGKSQAYAEMCLFLGIPIPPGYSRASYYQNPPDHTPGVFYQEKN